MSMLVEIWPLRSLDYQAVADLWQQEQGIVVRDFDDSEAGFDRMIRHNPYLCLGLWEGEQLVGAALTGFDGRRAYIYHFIIAAHRRRNGLGKQLAAALDQAMRRKSINKAHLFVLRHNTDAQKFWCELDWYLREDVSVYSRSY